MDGMIDLAGIMGKMGGNKAIEPVYQKLGQNIARMREGRGMSQLEVAQKCGMGSSTVAEIETGKTRILLSDVEKIAAALGTEPKMLMQGIWF